MGGVYSFGEVSNCHLINLEAKKITIGDFSRVRNSYLGTHVRIDRNNFIIDSTLGDYTYTGPFLMMFKACIGNFTSISYGVTIGPPEHNYSRLTQHPFIIRPEYGILSKEEIIENDELNDPMMIGNDVWIGCNSTILRGVEIGDGAIVGANSVVTKNVPPYAIVAGCPAKVLKYRFEPEIIERLLRLKWWEWDIDKIRKNKSLFTKILNKGNSEILNQVSINNYGNNTNTL